MCKAYTIHFVKRPCSASCGRQLTTRVRPCPFLGTPGCHPEPNHQIEVQYRCAMHFQATVYPEVNAFTENILTYNLPTTLDDEGNRITKLSALDPEVGLHIRQFGYCTYVAYQDEYYEAARTNTYMQLHSGALPPGVDQPPRRHGQILRGLRAKLDETYARFCDGDYWVKTGVPMDQQPERGQFFYAYPLLGAGHFDQLMVDIEQRKVTHYTFADIFDNLGWDEEGRGESPSEDEGDGNEMVEIEGIEISVDYEEGDRESLEEDEGLFYFVSDDEEEDDPGNPEGSDSDDDEEKDDGDDGDDGDDTYPVPGKEEDADIPDAPGVTEPPGGDDTNR